MADIRFSIRAVQRSVSNSEDRFVVSEVYRAHISPYIPSSPVVAIDDAFHMHLCKIKIQLFVQTAIQQRV